MPYAFTEQQSIFIMRAFKEMRHYIRQNQQFVTRLEMNLISAKVSELSVQMSGFADYRKKTDKSMEEIQKSIDTLNENFISEKDFKNFVIYKGQKFEADTAYIEIYQVEVILFTENSHGKRGFLTTAVVEDFINQ